MTNGPLFLVEDSRHLTRVFSDKELGAVDLVLTSPPYFDVKNYDNLQQQIGYKQTYSEYIDDVVDILRQCYKIAKNDATLWCVVDTVRRNGLTYPIPFDITKKLNDLLGSSDSTQDTWILRDIMIWNRSKNLPWHAKGRLKNEFEYILFFSKGDEYRYHIDKVREIADYKKWWLTYPERYNSSGRPPSNVWEFTTPIRGWGNGYQEHLCPFPFPLIERILSLSSDKNNMVFDPFAGSGSVMALAKQMGRNAVGFDINPKYKEQFENEVLVGAQKYWQRRTSELERTRSKIEFFKQTNLRLRKIKAGIQLARVVREQIADDAVFFVMDSQDQAPGISLIVLRRPNGCCLDVSAFQGSISRLQSEFKLSISVSLTDRTPLASIGTKNRNLFAYQDNRIYRYDSTFPIAYIAANLSDKRYVFSDIEVKIDNPDSFLK